MYNCPVLVLIFCPTNQTEFSDSINNNYTSILENIKVTRKHLSLTEHLIMQYSHSYSTSLNQLRCVQILNPLSDLSPIASYADFILVSDPMRLSRVFSMLCTCHLVVSTQWLQLLVTADAAVQPTHDILYCKFSLVTPVVNITWIEQNIVTKIKDDFHDDN